jgi:hypothetical protein
MNYCILLFHSPLCNDQIRIVNAPSIPTLVNQIAPPLVYGSKFAILFPDGLASPHNVTALYRFAFWDCIGSLHSTGQCAFMSISVTMISLVSLLPFALVAFYGSFAFSMNRNTARGSRLRSCALGTQLRGCIHDRTDLVLRHRIPYEIFYAVHLLFILYIVTVAHTVDHMQRSNTRPESNFPLGIKLSCTISAIGRLHTSIITTRQSSNRLLLPQGRIQDGSPEDAAPYSLRLQAWPVRFVRLSFIDSSWHPSPSRQDQTRLLSNFTLKYSTSSPGLESCGN